MRHNNIMLYLIWRCLIIFARLDMDIDVLRGCAGEKTKEMHKGIEKEVFLQF